MQIRNKSPDELEIIEVAGPLRIASGAILVAWAGTIFVQAIGSGHAGNMSVIAMLFLLLGMFAVFARKILHFDSKSQTLQVTWKLFHSIRSAKKPLQEFSTVRLARQGSRRGACWQLSLHGARTEWLLDTKNFHAAKNAADLIAGITHLPLSDESRDLLAEQTASKSRFGKLTRLAALREELRARCLGRERPSPPAGARSITQFEGALLTVTIPEIKEARWLYYTVFFVLLSSVALLLTPALTVPMFRQRPAIVAVLLLPLGVFWAYFHFTLLPAWIRLVGENVLRWGGDYLSVRSRWGVFRTQVKVKLDDVGVIELTGDPESALRSPSITIEAENISLHLGVGLSDDERVYLLELFEFQYGSWRQAKLVP